MRELPGFEIDRRSPAKTYYCRMGLYISPVSQCQRRECYLWEPCQGKKFWKGPKSFRSLSKISPDTVVKVDRYDSPNVIQSNKLNISVETINILQAKIYIDSVIFYSSYFTQPPIIRLRETPGYRVTTKAMAFSFNGPSIEKFVETVLANDPEIFSWVFTKYFVWSNYDVNDLVRVSSFFWNLFTSKMDSKTIEYAKRIKVREITPEIIQFGVSLLMHGLAHLIHEEVISMLQTSPQNLEYFHSRKPESDGKYRVFIIENAEKGLGLTQSFAATVARAGSKYLSDFAERLNRIVALDSRTPLGYSPPTQASADVKMIWDRVNEYQRNFQVRFGVSMPVEFARYVLNRYDPKTMNVIQKDEVSPYIDDILSGTPLCWDGCYHCVRLESQCHDSPYEQVFGVSKSLLLAFLNEWLGTFRFGEEGGEAKTLVQIGDAKKLLNYIKRAKNEVVIISPWFSRQVAKTICDVAREQGIRFKILTSNDESVETHLEALKVFAREGNSHVGVRVLVDRFPHIKLIIVDNALLIMGSANLTLSGLYDNIEGYVIIDDAENVRKSIHSFDRFRGRCGTSVSKIN